MITSDETVSALYLSSFPSKISSTSVARSNVMFDANECWPNPTAHVNSSNLYDSQWYFTQNTHTTALRPLFRDHPGEPVPKENFWTFWCKGRLTEADTPTIWLGATPSGFRTNQCPPPPSPHFLQARCPSCRPTNSVKALKARSVIFYYRKIS